MDEIAQHAPMATENEEPGTAVLPFVAEGSPGRETLAQLLSTDQPLAVARALAGIPHSRIATVASELTLEAQLRLLQQLVNLRTVAPKAALELARGPQGDVEPAPAPRAKAG